ncbi:MAG TPA: 3-oxoacyl-ACP reductase FabG [Solirubrobacterales bacterium]|nr:3-oxoacyl-ACP reductase FabG [Solirubrobacterales bacterium]
MSEGVALVTGASGGIGAAVAETISAQGRPVAVHYRSDRDGADAVVARIEASGGEAAAFHADISDPEAIDGLVAGVEDRLGPVLVLVNNAGRRADGLAPQLDDDQWDRVIETNLNAAFRLTRRTLKPMLRARFGRIVNVASIVGPRANAGQANYAASKAGLIGMTRTIAVEVARRGVTVNAVAPGFVETGLTADLPEDAFAGEIPLRRAGTAEEIAACVGFLASDAASYVTGTTLTADGGLSA